MDEIVVLITLVFLLVAGSPLVVIGICLLIIESSDRDKDRPTKDEWKGLR